MRFYVFSCALFVMQALLGSPKNGTCQYGDAKISQKGQILTVKNSKDSVIHWDQFSIHQGETVQFIQKNQKNAVLNRVVGGEKSLIYGQLTSNGKVFLLNPNGILIGPQGRIETAGFVGSTLDLLDSDFLEGKDLLFQNPGHGEITNLGTITCSGGDLTLIARKVENKGNLHVQGGVATLTAGTEVLLKVGGASPIFIRPEDVSAVEQTQNPYEMAVRNSGTITATATKEEKGRIYLVADQGETAVSGSVIAKGGNIHVLGKDITLTETAHMSTSSSAKGGEILIGGDYRGGNPDVPNAKSVLTKKGAVIEACALENGDGGRVIVWGDEKNHFYGYICVEGGAKGGDGGFIEISAKEKNWIYKGNVSMLAPNGKAGTVLFDPADITISTDPTTDPFDPPLTYETVNASATLNTTELVTALNSSGNVIVDSTTGAGGTGIGFIRVSDPISWSSANSLTLTAGRQIEINATITNAGSGDLNMTANSAELSTGTFDGITISSALSTTGGNITLDGKGGPTGTTRGVNIAAGITASSGGTINITGEGLGDAGGANHGIQLSGGGSLSASGSTITLNGTSSATGGGSGNGVLFSTALSVGSGSLNTTGVSNTVDGIQLSGILSASSGNLLLDGTGGVAGGDGTSISANITTSSGDITLIGLSNSLLIFNHHGVTTGNVDILSSTGNISIMGTGPVSGGACTGVHMLSGGSPTISTGGNGTITINGISRSSGSNSFAVRLERMPITTVNGDITVTGDASGSTGNSNHGISMASPGGDDSILRTTGSGNIIMNGTGGTGSSSIGVRLGGNADTTVETQGTGNITITADASLASGTAPGLIVDSARIETSGGGTLTINATGGTSTGRGVSIENAGRILTVNGAIDITGTGGGSSSGQGVYLEDTSSRIIAAGTGTIRIEGHGSPTAGIRGRGLDMQAGTAISSDSGSITIEGTGNGSGAATSCEGVFLTGNPGALISTTAGGTINVTGRGFDAVGASNEGVHLATTGDAITGSGTGAGSITVTGIGGGNSADAAGVRIAAGSGISDAAIISVTGTASSSADDNSQGVILAGVGAAITGADTSITLNGTGGGTGASDAGVSIQTALVDPQTASGIVSITGVGSSNGSTEAQGVNIDGAGAVVRTQGGALTIRGTGGGLSGDNSGVQVDNSALVETTAGGNILIPTAAGGGGGSSDGLQMDGSTISASGAGAVTVSATGGTSSSLNRGINLQANSEISTVNGDLSLTGSGTGAGGAGVRITGISIARSTGSGAVTVNGTGGAVAGDSAGILVTGAASAITTVSGAINATGRAGGSTNEGIFVQDSGVIQSTTGAITAQALSDVSITSGSSITSAGPVSVTASRDILVTAGALDAEISSTGSTTTVIANRDITLSSPGAGMARIIGNGAVTIVVDNAFPTPPGIGTGALSKDLNSEITSVTSTVQIFTARQTLNNIEGEINGVLFVPGPEFIASDTERWGVYFPSFFGGTPFTIFYKDTSPLRALRIYELQVAEAQLQDLLRRLDLLNRPYMGEFCTYDPQTEELRDCGPTFHPYGSFILYDQVYWIGRQWKNLERAELLRAAKATQL